MHALRRCWAFAATLSAWRRPPPAGRIPGKAGTVYAAGNLARPMLSLRAGTQNAFAGVDVALFRWHPSFCMKILDVPQSGSVAGQTSSRNRFGQYRRTRAIPVNPNTSAQQAARDDFAAASVAWRGLTQAQRDAWASFALTRPKTNSLGQTIYLTGHQTFVGYRALFASLSLALPTVPPVSAAPVITSFTISDETPTAFESVALPNPVPAATAYEYQSSPPLSEGRSFNGDFRTVKVAAAASVPELTAASLTAKWGTLIGGQKFFLRVRPVSVAGGDGAWVTVSTVLT